MTEMVLTALKRAQWPKLDRVWLTIAALLLATWLLTPADFSGVLGDSLRSLGHTGIFIAFAVGAVAYMRATGSEVLLWDRNGGWFFDPAAGAAGDWREAPTLSTFEGKKPTWARVAAVGDRVVAAAWFRTTSKIRLARLVGKGDDQSWEWRPETELDGDLSELRTVGDQLVVIDDDIPTKAYRFDGEPGKPIRYDEFPTRSVRDHLVLPVGDALALIELTRVDSSWNWSEDPWAEDEGATTE